MFDVVSWSPWLVLLAFCALTWAVTPARVGIAQFFDGRRNDGQAPGIWTVAMSAAVTWVFAKSIANASALGESYGITGGIGYALYYLSFVVAGVAIYLLRTRGGWRSLPQFITARYGIAAARLFLCLVAFRLVNEIWSNTKVMSGYFGAEGSLGYWLAVVLVTAFTIAYAWRGGMRASLTTDRVHIILAFVLLALVLGVVLPPVAQGGIPRVASDVRAGGLTFCALALVQVLSYPFHDPVLTDRGFLNRPRQQLAAFLLAAVLSGSFILLFSVIGLYGLAFNLPQPPSLTVPASLGLPMLLAFNAIMLMTGGSTIDSTLTSIAKLAGRDWRAGGMQAAGEATAQQMRTGRIALVVVAVVGNLPLLTLYLGDRLGPAVIAATTISGTMVMGLAPVFLLAWVRGAGPLAFHLAFWPGVAIGVVRGIEAFGHVVILPAALSLGSGEFAVDLGANVWGLALCTVGFLAGTVLAPRRVMAVA